MPSCCSALLSYFDATHVLAMFRVFSLYAVLVINTRCAAVCALSTGAQAAAARTQHRQLLAALRPEAVSLVDAFGWEDYALNSALGRADGDVYTALLNMARTSPLNRTEAGPAWETVLKPVMHRKPLPKL